MPPWVRSCARACLAGCLLSWRSDALLHAARSELDSHSELAHQAEGKPRVALVLRGEAFRAGRSARQYVAGPNYTRIQEANYESQLAQVVRPFEEDGYDVDVFSATYSTPYDATFEESFGPRLKVFKKLKFLRGKTQSTNAAENVNAVRDYARMTGNTYRFVIFARQDARFLTNMRDLIMSYSAPDDTVLLYMKHPFGASNSSASTEKRCRNANEHGWSVKDRGSLSWWCNDRIQIIPWKHFEAFWQLIAGPTLLEPPLPWAPFDNPRWPYECWEEFAPLVGGNGHIAFMEENVVAICKATMEHGTKREFDAHKRRAILPDCEMQAR